MRSLLFFSLIALLPATVFSQENPLDIFDKLVDKSWEAFGNWGDGSKFKQVISFRYALDSSIVITNSMGFTDNEQLTFGPRNHGIRQYDATSDSIRFWEFDVFGGATEGVVYSAGENIFYQYQYSGTTFTDMWEYVDDNTYNFKVGRYKDGVWQQIYLSTRFVAKKE